MTSKQGIDQFSNSYKQKIYIDNTCSTPFESLDYVYDMKPNELYYVKNKDECSVIYKEELNNNNIVQKFFCPASTKSRVCTIFENQNKICLDNVSNLGEAVGCALNHKEVNLAADQQISAIIDCNSKGDTNCAIM